MNNRTMLLAIVLFVVVVVGMFVFAFLKKQEVSTVPDQSPVASSSPEEQVAYASITRITAKHFFADGLHTFTGEILLPTPCDLLTHDVTVAESYPEQVSLQFDVVNNSEVCAQVVTPARFKIEVEASKEASFSATLAGRAIELNLIPPQPGESPDDFEVYFKG